MSRVLLLCVLTFAATVPWGSAMVRFLRARGIGKRIRLDGPSSHQVKMGTPTMGGILIFGPVILVTLVLNLAGRYSLLLPLGAIVAFGVLGAIDDLGGLTDNLSSPMAPQLGILGRHMILYQTIIALAAAATLFWLLDSQGVAIPGISEVRDLGLWYLPLATLVIVATANAVNITDGLDGLAGGTSGIAFAAYGLIAFIQGQSFLAGFCFTIVGALMAYLWYNAHPAAVFMGGVGSLTLGAALAIVALMTDQWLLLPLIGSIFTINTASDLLQVGYFKYTRLRFGEGRRIFRKAPLHHHFEMIGWSEVQVTTRFWIIGLASAMVGLALAAW